MDAVSEERNQPPSRRPNVHRECGEQAASCWRGAALSIPVLAAPLRIGTLEDRAVALAFYRSPLWTQAMAARKAELEEAQRAGDTKRVQALQAWGAGQQERAHQQVFGDAPIGNVLEMLGPALPEIARKAKVKKIVPGRARVPAGAERVDVTDLVIEWLKVDEKTARMVREFRANMPPPVKGPHKH